MTPLPPHAHIRPLANADLQHVMKLEQKTLPNHMRSRREKIEYYLKNCPELCTGIFLIPEASSTNTVTNNSKRSKVSNDSNNSNNEKDGKEDMNTEDGEEVLLTGPSKAEKQRPPMRKLNDDVGEVITHDSSSDSKHSDSAVPDGPAGASPFQHATFSDDEDTPAAIELSDDLWNVAAVKRDQEVLIAHVLSTKYRNPNRSDIEEHPNDIENTQTAEKEKSKPKKSSKKDDSPDLTIHDEAGDDIYVHTLAIDPDFRGMKLGSTIMYDYVQRLAGQKVAKRVLVPGVQEEMLGFWERMGFYVLDDSDITGKAPQLGKIVWISLEEGFDDDDM